jgi:hypothetical protein
MNKRLGVFGPICINQLSGLPIVDKLLIPLDINDPCTYVCGNSSRHASHQISAPGRLFFCTHAN